MTNITLDGLPAKTGTISDAGIIHYREGGVDKKMTVADFLIRISEEYSSDINTFLGAADKAAGRAALGIARRTTVNNADYTILVTDKVVAQTGTMSAARTFTLPSAALYPAGEELVVADQSFTVNQEFKIILARAGSDTFNDGNTSIEIIQKGGAVRLVGDGVSKWSILSSGNPFASALFSNKNVVINGDFNFWQRGTSFTSIADAAYSADRFQYAKSGSMVHDITRSTDVPTVAQAGRLINYSMKVDCQTLDSSIASGEYCSINQPIEGYNWLALAQKPITLSFWVKATKIGTYCARLSNSGADRSCVMEYTVNTTNTWERKTITFPASPSAGTWNFTTGIGATLGFTLAVGSAIQTTAGAWQSGIYIGTSNQVNACDSISNDFYLCGIQLEAGSVATPFEQRLHVQELQLCQRYFRGWGGVGNFDIVAEGWSTDTTHSNFHAFLEPWMRAAPTLTTSGNWQTSDGNIGVAITAFSLIGSSTTDKNATILVTVASGLTAYRPARLETANNTTARLYLSAEL